MTHTIRQHGQLTQIDCELGSDIFDKHGKEIFEGDIISNGVDSLPIEFASGSLLAIHKGDGIQLYQYFADGFEIVGHVGD